MFRKPEKTLWEDYRFFKNHNTNKKSYWKIFLTWVSVYDKILRFLKNVILDEINEYYQNNEKKIKVEIDSFVDILIYAII